MRPTLGHFAAHDQHDLIRDPDGYHLVGSEQNGLAGAESEYRTDGFLPGGLVHGEEAIIEDVQLRVSEQASRQGE